MATPTIREVLHDQADGQNTVTVVTDVGTQVDDLLVVFHANDWFTAAGLGAPTGTAGTWTQRAVGDLGTNNSHIKCWTRPVTVAGAQTVTCTRVNNEEHGLALFVLAGVDLADPVDDAAGTSGGSSTSHNAPSVSPATSDALLLCGVAAAEGSTGTYTAVSGGMVEQTEDALLDSVGVQFSSAVTGSQALTTAGPTGTRTFTYSQSQQFAAVSIAIRGIGDTGITGTLDATLPGLVGTTAGTATATGDLTATLPGATAALAGSLTTDGTLAVALPGLSAALAGTVVDTTARGSLSAMLPGLSAALAGASTVGATLTGSLPGLSGTLAGTVVDTAVRGPLAATLPALSADLAGTLTASGVLAAALPALVGPPPLTVGTMRLATTATSTARVVDRDIARLRHTHRDPTAVRHIHRTAATMRGG